MSANLIPKYRVTISVNLILKYLVTVSANRKKLKRLIKYLSHAECKCNLKTCHGDCKFNSKISRYNECKFNSKISCHGE